MRPSSRDRSGDEFEELPAHEPAWAVLDRVTIYRKQLLASGYSPVPVNGKAVQLERLARHTESDHQRSSKRGPVTRADHLNTGVLTRDTPFIDIDVTDEEVAEEIEALFESEIENSAVRIGLSAEARHSVSVGHSIQEDSHAI